MSILLSIASSAVAGLTGALLLPSVTSCRSKRKHKKHGNDDIVVGFLLGSAFGAVAGVPVQLQLISGAKLSGALECAAVTVVVWTPFYVMTVACGAKRTTRYAVPSAVSTTAAVAGVVWGCSTYAMDGLPTLGASALVVAVTWDLVAVLIVISRGSVTSTLPVAVESILYSVMAMALYGMATGQHELCFPFLCVCSVLLPYSGWYGLRLSLAVMDSVPALTDSETQTLIVKKPGTVPEPAPGGVEVEVESAASGDALPAAEVAASHISSVDATGAINPAFHLPPPVTAPAIAVLDIPPTAEFHLRTCHVFVIPNYNESLALLHETLSVLASHPNACMRYGVLLAMEEKETVAEEKAATLVKAFLSRFRWIGHSVHPLHHGEMPGKGSNLNFAVRELAGFWTLASPQDTMLTILDADCLLPAAYIQYIDWLWHTDASLVKHNLFSPMSPLSANSSELPCLVRTWEAVYQVGITGLLTMSQGVRWPFAVYSLTLRISMDVGYWDPTLLGVAEDMMNALRVWLHFAEKGAEPRLIVIKVPYWCQAESSVAARWQQQVRHCLALQAMGFTLCHTAGLPWARRLYLTGLVNLNMLAAFSLPPVVLVCNALQFSRSPIVFWWAEGCLLSALPGVVMYGVLLYHGLQLTSLSEGKPAPALLTSCSAVLSSLVCTPVVVGMQQLCALQARFWLLFHEMGLTEITYQGARQNAE